MVVVGFLPLDGLLLWLVLIQLKKKKVVYSFIS